MFPGPPSGLSIAKVISGISRSLNLAQQIIPLYEQAKPMVQNARKAFSLLKEINFNSNSNSSHSNPPQIAQKVTNKSIKNTAIPSSSNFNNPSFFQ